MITLSEAFNIQFNDKPFLNKMLLILSFYFIFVVVVRCYALSCSCLLFFCLPFSGCSSLLNAYSWSVLLTLEQSLFFALSCYYCFVLLFPALSCIILLILAYSSSVMLILAQYCLSLISITYSCSVFLILAYSYSVLLFLFYLLFPILLTESC